MSSFTFQVDRSKYLKLLEDGTKDGLIAVGEQAVADSNEFVKVDQGALKQSGKFQVVGKDVEISYNTPYAKRQYFTGTPRHGQNPQASLMWMHKAAKTYGKDWLKIMNKKLAERLGR